MRVKLILAVLFINTLGYSQNLVRNPSFESGVDECLPTIDASEFEIYANYWNCPTLGTADIFSIESDATCPSHQPDSVIYKRIGSQTPRTGKRYAGIIAYQNTGAIDSTYREYIQVTLKEPLIPGEYYCAEMYVSAADYVTQACNNLAMLFTNYPTLNSDQLFFGILRFNPQIVETEVITDTLNWVRISGTFQARDSSQFLTIGNFNSTKNTDTLKLRSFPDFSEISRDFAYYFIDDVSVEHLPKKPFLKLPDWEICLGDSITLSVSNFEDVTWTTLKDTLTILQYGSKFKIAPDRTTQYRAKIRNCNVEISDTINVVVDEFLQVKLGNDTTICEGNTIKLNAGTALGSAYQWQDNSNSQYFVVTTAGKYSVNVSNSNNSCEGYDEINIRMLGAPILDLGRDTLTCDGFFPLKAGYGNLSYKWSTGEIDSIFTPSHADKYWVTVRNQCGQTTDSIQIMSKTNVFVPNVVTLNNDLHNDDFRVVVLNDNHQQVNIPVIGTLSIFDRWGKLIFTRDEYSQGWPKSDGSVETGVYYYLFNQSGCQTYKGWIHVIK